MAFSKKEMGRVDDRIDESTKGLLENQKMQFLKKTISIDKVTDSMILSFQKDKKLDYSSAIRFIINDYFERK